jgi:hypothetical protein
MTGDTRLIRALVACYPVTWRRRYGAEYAQLLCDLRVQRRPRLIVDSLCGAVRAYGGALMSESSPTTTVIWAAGLFAVAGAGFAKLAEDFAGRSSGRYVLLVAAAAVVLLALSALLAPTAVALLRSRGTGAWRYLAVPLVGAASWYGVLRLALLLASGHGAHSVETVTGFLLIAGAGIALVAATAWAVATLVRRVPAARSARLRPVAVTTTAVGMAVATLTAVAWGLPLRSVDPSALHGNHGILATPFVPSWIAVVAAFATATALATTAARRQLAAPR